MLWAWIGSIYLAVMTYSDVKCLKIDDKWNFIMLGVSIALYEYFRRPLWYVLVIVGLVVLMSYLFGKFKVIAEGDISAMRWLFLGFILISPFTLAGFSFVLILLSALQFGFFWAFTKLKGVRGRIAYYPVILLSFIINCWFWGLY